METEQLLGLLVIFALAFVQNVSFTLVSRSRNRNNIPYHISASILSNTLWFLCIRQLLREEMSLTFLVPYVVGTVSGSVIGVKISMVIERWLGANSDGHLQRTT